MQFDWGGRLLKNNEGFAYYKVNLKKFKYFLLSIIVKISQTVRLTNQAETKVGYNEQLILYGKVNSKGT